MQKFTTRKIKNKNLLSILARFDMQNSKKPVKVGVGLFKIWLGPRAMLVSETPWSLDDYLNIFNEVSNIY
jgi:hypothetical protein